MKDQRPGHAPAMTPAGAKFMEAVRLHREGQGARADALCAEVLRVEPANFNALHLRGLLALERGDLQAGFDLIGKSLSIAPNQPAAHSNLGNGYLKVHRYAEALASFDRAIAMKPDYAVAYFNRGNALCGLNRIDEALSSYQRSLALDPGNLGVVSRLTRVLLDQKRAEDALKAAEYALHRDPANYDAEHNRGEALFELARLDDALSAYDRALTLRPTSVQTLINRGNVLTAMRRYEAAIESYARALALEADSYAAHLNIGIAMLAARRMQDALVAFDAAIRLGGVSPQALAGKAQALETLKRLPEAAACLEELLKHFPREEYVRGHLAQIKLDTADWRGIDAEIETMVRETGVGHAAVNPMTLLAVSGDPTVQLRAAALFGRDETKAVDPLPRLRGGYGHARIRLAYVSADLREHAFSYLMAGIFEKHDRERFEVIAISFRKAGESAFAARVATAFDRFIDVSERSDRDVAKLMRELEIDIAVDAMGYTQDSRSAVFANRCAPVQVNYLGFPGTLGANAIDYLLADDFVVPPVARRYYGERVVYLPQCFQANDDKRVIGPAGSRAEVMLPEGAFVFASFNNIYKLNPATFDVWCRILTATPGSVLWLVAGAEGTRANLRSEAQRRGVAGERLVFAERKPYAEHLGRLSHADLVLDNLPFNGGTTASDALWAGVPLLTRAGEAFVSRMAGSLLRAVGLPELITHSWDDYERLAVRLAHDRDRLLALRARLVRNWSGAVLFDTARQCRYLEAAYEHMWRRAENGEDPREFVVPA